MEGLEVEGSASAAHTGPPESQDLDHDLDLDYSSPVGSPDHEHHHHHDVLPEIHALPSDDDHDHDHDHDHDPDPDHDHDHGPEHEHEQEQVQGPPGGPAVLTDDLKHKIIKQAEYYFSDENLPNDKHMMSLVKKNKEGFVPIAVIGSFRKMKKLTRDYKLIAAALRESSFLVVNPNGKRVKRLHPLQLTEPRDPKLYTVLVENLPEDHSMENIQRIFGGAGKVKNICFRDPHAVEESKGSKPDMLISSKLHALVEYETVAAAEKAVATLNDEQDWRNGMRVKPLNRVGKYVQRRQPWRGSDSERNNSSRGSDSERNSTSRGSDHTGDEENHNLSEHHDDIPDEEDGEHLSKEKNGHKGRNQGRPRRQNYRGNNGLGHGRTSSTHPIEASKPPPGPRMPDGTRGFTMGRGRPPITNQS